MHNDNNNIKIFVTNNQLFVLFLLLQFLFFFSLFQNVMIFPKVKSNG